MREAGDCVAERLAGMAFGIEPVFDLQPDQSLAQDRNFLWRLAQGRTGPQSGVDRKAGDLPAFTLRHNQQVQRDAAMDA